MAQDTQIPAPLTGIVPYVNVEGASAASEFYQKAFGAKELARIPAEDGKRLMHCHLHINGGDVMISDCFPEHGHAFQSSSCFTLHQQLTDVDQAWDRAVAAGCEVIMPLELMFWGDRYGILVDPFQVRWSLASTPAVA